jgi:DNA-binding response OmpR family regulator
MQHWDDFTYGPLQVFSTAGRLLKFDNTIVGLGRSSFTVMLRLMACQGGVVSQASLIRGLSSGCTLRLAICRLRRFLKQYFGTMVTIKTVRQYGYRLSIAESLIVIPYGDFVPEPPRARLFFGV